MARIANLVEFLVFVMADRDVSDTELGLLLTVGQLTVLVRPAVAA